jgi:hypothetical protein
MKGRSQIIPICRPKDSIKTLRSDKHIWQHSRIQISTQKSVAFLCARNEQSEKKVRKTIPCKAVSKN